MRLEFFADRADEDAAGGDFVAGPQRVEQCGVVIQAKTGEAWRAVALVRFQCVDLFVEAFEGFEGSRFCP